MSSPIEVRWIQAHCPPLSRPFAVGLNIGCGGRKIGSSIGVDFRPDAGAAVMITDARGLPVRSESLDYIVSCHCLEHLRDGPLAVLREWVRCLKPGAPLALCVPDGGTDPHKMLLYQVPAGKSIPGQHVHLFTMDSLKVYLECAGLVDVVVERIDRHPYWKSGVLGACGVRGLDFQEAPYRWRAWTWAKEVMTDLPVLPRIRQELRDRKERSLLRKLFHV